MAAYTINYNLKHLAIECFRSDSFAVLEEYEKASNMHAAFFTRLFYSLKNNNIDGFYYDSGKNRYLFTRSAKCADTVQKTCIWIRGNDDLEPLSDRQYKKAVDMVNDGLPDGVTVYTF